jgi:hypothetical protein
MTTASICFGSIAKMRLRKTAKRREVKLIG